MSKKRNFILVVVLAVAIVSVVLGVNLIERSPFDDITPENVKSVDYHIYYYENEEAVWLELPEDKIEEFYELVHNIKITGFGSDYHHNLNGGVNIMFKVQLNDDTVVTVADISSGMVIDDKYYRSDYSGPLYEFWRKLAIAGREEYGLTN